MPKLGCRARGVISPPSGPGALAGRLQRPCGSAEPAQSPPQPLQRFQPCSEATALAAHRVGQGGLHCQAGSAALMEASKLLTCPLPWLHAPHEAMTGHPSMSAGPTKTKQRCPDGSPRVTCLQRAIRLAVTCASQEGLKEGLTRVCTLPLVKHAEQCLHHCYRHFSNNWWW